MAVRACGTVERLNLLALGEEEVEWDLRGRLNSVIDVAFVASRLESQGRRLLSLDISGNTLTTDESLTLARAVAYTPHLTYLNGLFLGDSQARLGSLDSEPRALGADPRSIGKITEHIPGRFPGRVFAHNLWSFSSVSNC